MSPVIYVSPAFRTACAEPRGAFPAALRSGSLRADCRQCGKRCAPAHPVRAERLVSCTHAHGLRLGSETDIVLFYCRPAL